MMGLSALNPPRAGAGALRGNAASRPALPASNLCAAAAPLLPVRPLLRRRHSTHRRPAVASNGNGAATLSPKAVLEETRDLRARFEALQAEVAAYRKLNDENALLAQEVERVVQDNKQLSLQLDTSKEELEHRVGAARQAAELRAEALLTELQEWKADRESILALVAESAGRMGAAVEAAGGGPVVAPLAAEPAAASSAAPAPAAPEAPQQADGNAVLAVLSWVVAALRTVLYYALGCLVLYYAVSILAPPPPPLNLEFGLGTFAVCWAMQLLARVVAPRTNILA